jgi:hypothetical protein
MSSFADYSVITIDLRQLVSKTEMAQFGYKVSCQVYSTIRRGFASVKRGLKLPIRLMSTNMDKRSMRDLVT